ncbi:MAG: hypothetical protein KC472_13200, partial [Dehalococcoidia bacterium]|nr:hypothetical protein [Dehalococcoidia bacterium]
MSLRQPAPRERRRITVPMGRPRRLPVPSADEHQHHAPRRPARRGRTQEASMITVLAKLTAQPGKEAEMQAALE